MTRARATKSLFQATKAKVKGDNLPMDMPKQEKPYERDPLDYDPTPEDATRPFIEAEYERLKELGGVTWENAVGGGHIARVLAEYGFPTICSDVVNRGYPGTVIKDFMEVRTLPRGVTKIITNPPYNMINARDGHGRWLRQTMELGVPYCAMLLNWDWIAARKNGMDELHEAYPVSRIYVCCWKIDFRQLGAPPQRNGWLVCDKDHTGPTTFHRLFKEVQPRNQIELPF